MRVVPLSILFFILSCLRADAQQRQNLVHQQTSDKKFYEYCLDTTKKNKIFIYLVDKGSQTANAIRNNSKKFLSEIMIVNNRSTPFLKIHGNVLYDVNYYSNYNPGSAAFISYYQKNFYQHTLQAYLDITIKDKYPLRVYLTKRFNNSFSVKNFTDVNLLYSNSIFNQNIKDRLKKKMLESVKAGVCLDSLKAVLEQKYKELALLRSWQNNPAILQKLVEAREQALYKNHTTDSIESDSLYKQFPFKNTLPPDTIFQSGKKQDLQFSLSSDNKKLPGFNSSRQTFDSLLTTYETNAKRLNSLNREVERLQSDYNKLNQKITNASAVSIKEIDEIKNPKELQKKMEELNIHDSSLAQGYRTLMALRSIGVGRNIINYSELSLKNISVTGLQVEYNPSYYLAFAAGTVDYQFRDFIVENNNPLKQYAGVMRVGKGMKEGNNIIFTYYTGRRQIYNAFTDTISQNVQAPSPYLMGFTVEGNYRIGQNNMLTAEVAKSSFPYYANTEKSASLLSGTVRFSDHSNEAYCLKLNSYIPATLTSINGYYKHLGINFQSFSIFTNGSSQSSWNLRVIQPFFKRMLEIAASVNSNDFTNPYLPQGFKSSTVFKSIQVTLRKNKWPVLSAGYFPSSQLTKLNEDQYIQNLFYTFTSNVSHCYRFHDHIYTTSLLYTQFYNKPGDSNFVYFNTKNLLINQTVFLRRFTLQFDGSEAVNTYYHLYVIDGNLQFNCNRWLSVGAGLKYNQQTVYHISQVGYSGNAIIKIPLLGEFRLMADKGFIPGPDRQLVPNNIGRFTYSKTF